MLEFWFEHLSNVLSKPGTIAYLWHSGSDKFLWAGNVKDILGFEPDALPQDSAAFNRILNPQDLPKRSSALHAFMTSQSAQDVFACEYIVHAPNGAQVNAAETAVLHIDVATGEKLICGSIEARSPAVRQSLPVGDVHVPVLHESASMPVGRRAMRHRLEEWIEESRGRKTEGYLLAVGIDRLSMLNEAFGAGYIDELIDRTGDRLRQITGEAAVFGRIDGDVFCLFFRNASASEMAAVARHILSNFFDHPIETTRGPMSVRVSIGGLPVSSQNLRDPATAITQAETAMRAAKDRGRGCFISYTEAMTHASDQRELVKAGDEFMRALREDRVRLAFQPVIETNSEKVKFHECLIRMLDGDGRLVPAGKFIPAIEELGMSRLVDQYAMRTAIEELNAFSDLNLSVNVSNQTLANPDWLRGVVASLRDRPSVAKRLIIEITESAVVRDMSHSVKVSRTLKELGCRVALDDFGTGYTAFSHIKDMNVDIVKIDKSFVRNLDNDQNKLFVRTLQSLAQGVNVQTVGEGAESINDVRRLTTDGIDYIQGYFYGFPRVERLWLPKDHVYRQIAMPAEAAPAGMGSVVFAAGNA